MVSSASAKTTTSHSMYIHQLSRKSNFYTWLHSPRSCQCSSLCTINMISLTSVSQTFDVVLCNKQGCSIVPECPMLMQVLHHVQDTTPGSPCHGPVAPFGLSDAQIPHHADAHVLLPWSVHLQAMLHPACINT